MNIKIIWTYHRQYMGAPNNGLFPARNFDVKSAAWFWKISYRTQTINHDLKPVFMILIKIG